MILRCVGAILIIFASGAMGVMMSYSYRKRIAALRNLINSTTCMAEQLRYQLLPLPELCQAAAQVSSGPVRAILIDLGNALHRCNAPEVIGVMEKILSKYPDLDPCVREELINLGKVLGRFDLEGQVSGIAAVTELAKRDLVGLEMAKEVRIRNYHTLAICAGIALVILFI